MFKRVMVLGVLLVAFSSLCGAQTLTGTALSGPEGAVLFEFSQASAGQAQFQLAWDDFSDGLFMLAACPVDGQLEIWGVSASQRPGFEHLNIGIPPTGICLISVAIGSDALITDFQIRMQTSAPGDLKSAGTVFRRVADDDDRPVVLAAREKLRPYVERMQARR